MSETPDNFCDPTFDGCVETCDMDLREITCEKNPGHSGFIPIADFCLSHIPERYRNSDFVNLCHSMSDVTFKMTADHISEKRQAPDPYFHHRGRNVVRCGTGYVHDIIECEDEIACACTCSECIRNKVPQRAFAEIHIATARHVVFDDSEARHTSAQLIYDGPKATGCDIKLHGIRMASTDVETDSCIIVCSIHDKERVKWLKKTKSKILDINSEVSRKLWNPYHSLAFIVSHPHGLAKHVSIGSWTHQHFGNDRGLGESNSRDCSAYISHVATCPGTSGALVYVLTEESTHSWTSFFTHSNQGYRLRRNYWNPFKNYENLHKNRFALALGSSYRSISADYHLFEADIASIDVRVIFPLGEIKSCVIWFHKRTVKQEKERLLQESDVDYGSPNEFIMQLVSPQMLVECDMEETMLTANYIKYLAGECLIKIVKKQQAAASVSASASSYGVNVKH